MDKTASKPSYSTSKRFLWLSQLMAWAILVAVTGGAIAGSEGAVALSGTAYPAMVGLIVLMLGIHRGLGSLDMWTMTRSPAALPSPPPYDPRADPAAPTGSAP